MRDSQKKYMELWGDKWENGNYPFNGQLTKLQILQIKKIYNRLQAEHAVRRYRRVSRQIKTLVGEN